ncbi:hypothetical protein PFISCL1PPCAC_16853, partial [Pristionchus fissidentatus]
KRPETEEREKDEKKEEKERESEEEKESSSDQKKRLRETSKRQFTDFAEFDKEMSHVQPYDEEEDADFKMDSSSDSGTDYDSVASRDMTPEPRLTEEEEWRMEREEEGRYLEKLFKRPATEEKKKEEKKESEDESGNEEPSTSRSSRSKRPKKGKEEEEEDSGRTLRKRKAARYSATDFSAFEQQMSRVEPYDEEEDEDFEVGDNSNDGSGSSSSESVETSEMSEEDE